MQDSAMSRRRFLGKTVVTASVAGLSSQALAAAKAQVRDANPYFYDVERLRSVDPKLIHFVLLKRFPVGKPDPRRIAIGPDGRLFVAAGNRVIVLDRDGTLLGDFAVGGEVRSVSVAADGTLFVGERDHVEILDAKGKPIASWPKLGGKPLITGIAVGEKDIFLADAG